jgi:hypothetical protein
MDSQKNLWGDLSQVETVRTPFVILQEQARILTRETKGALVGVVERLQRGQLSAMSLDILVPTLNNYRYSVVEMTYDSVQLYPLTILTGTQRDRICYSEEEFELALSEILSSPQVKKVIATLLSDVRTGIRR